MTNKQRLEEIFRKYQLSEVDYVDIGYLISRIKTLTQALQSIASEHRDGADHIAHWLELTHEQCAQTNANDTVIARKALEDES